MGHFLSSLVSSHSSPSFLSPRRQFAPSRHHLMNFLCPSLTTWQCLWLQDHDFKYPSNSWQIPCKPAPLKAQGLQTYRLRSHLLSCPKLTRTTSCFFPTCISNKHWKHTPANKGFLISLFPQTQDSLCDRVFILAQNSISQVVTWFPFSILGLEHSLLIS